MDRSYDVATPETLRPGTSSGVASCRCCRPEMSGCEHPPPCPSRPLAICGLLFFEGFIDEGAQPGADVEVLLDDEALEAFPPGITVEGATLKTRGGRVARGLATFPPARGAPAAKMRGSLPPPPPPPVRRHAAPCEAGRHRTALCRREFGGSLPTRLQCGFPGTTWTTTARTSPSEKGALEWSKRAPPLCATPRLKGGCPYDGTGVTPGGGNRRSILLRSRPRRGVGRRSDQFRLFSPLCGTAPHPLPHPRQPHRKGVSTSCSHRRARPPPRPEPRPGTLRASSQIPGWRRPVTGPDKRPINGTVGCGFERSCSPPP